MSQIGMQIAQRHLTTFDRLIGIIGDSGSGKSLLVSGMFPGLELTNDDSGVNVRPLPLLDIQENGFYQPHTYHIDMRFELAFTQKYIIAEAVRKALSLGRRVVVEHFDLLYPMLGMNAQLLIGMGDEIIVCHPTIFGPEPEEIVKIVFSSIKYRRMAHSAEDLTEHYLRLQGIQDKAYEHGDVQHGFLLRFRQEPQVNIEQMEQFVLDLIKKDISISYADNEHIHIGDIYHHCTGPRMHVSSTGEIENFHILPEAKYDELSDSYLLVGLVGESNSSNARYLNRINQL